jgi:hypothetical protein
VLSRLRIRRYIVTLPELRHGKLSVGFVRYRKTNGTARIENQIQKGGDIPEPHLIAYRLSREEILYSWLKWWDEQAGGQRFVFCANTLPDGCYLSKSVAKWEGDRNVYTEDRQEGGKKTTVGEIFEDISPNSFTQILEEGESGKELKPTVVIRATKVVPAVAPHP